MINDKKELRYKFLDEVIFFSKT